MACILARHSQAKIPMARSNELDTVYVVDVCQKGTMIRYLRTQIWPSDHDMVKSYQVSDLISWDISRVDVASDWPATNVGTIIIKASIQTKVMMSRTNPNYLEAHVIEETGR